MAQLAQDRATAPVLEPLETASGMVFGDRRDTADHAAGLPEAAPRPREVLEELLIPALSRPPCLVAFSGGRDSSALLATATHVARKHGLDDPIPATLRYAEHPRTWETKWQQLAIDHLALAEWEVIPIVDELDALGPFAQEVLRVHGPYWPPNAHAMVPLLRAAQGGTLVTGNGGDEVISGWGARRVRLIRRGRLKPRGRDAKPLLKSFVPAALKARYSLHRHPLRLPWLQPAPQHEVATLYAQKLATSYHSWQSALEWLAGSRYLELALGIFQTLARSEGAQLVEPFFHRRFIASVARDAPSEGLPERTTAMNTYFGDLLPAELISRSTKATFTEILMGPGSRAFAKDWDGGGLDSSLVRPDQLRQVWTSDRPDFRSFTPLQAAWHASRAHA